MGTENDIVAFVKRTLGFGKEDVELTDDHLQDAVDAAKVWYAHYLGQTKSGTLALADGTTEYAVPDDCDHVVEVVADTTDSILSWGFSDIPVNLTPLLPSRGGGSAYLADLTEMLTYTGNMKRTVAREQDWTYDVARRVLVIAPTNAGSTRVRYWYLTSAVDVTKLKLYEFGLVRDYAVACAQEVLGNIRSKYAELPGAAGGFSLNGDMLTSNAMSRKAELTEQLLRLQPPTGFIMR